MADSPCQTDRSLVPNRLGGGAFVGRHREMGELNAALEDALSGRGRVVMLVGEPGIGKTRTSEEMAIQAREHGAAVLWGRCPEESGVPPYWPWVQAIRSYAVARKTEALRAELGAGAAEIAEIVPEVKERLPDLRSPAPLGDPEQARFRFFDSIASFLKRASQTQPLLLVLDNLHWADPSSLRLLEFVAQELPGASVLLMGTYRDIDVSRGHPLFRTLGELTRQRLYQRVLLRGLSQDEVAQVIAGMGGITPPAELVAMVHQQTEGNPLFVGEVVRLLAQEGLLAAERLDALKSWDFRLPEGIREVIGRRLDRLSAGCNQVLTLAAVIGLQFSLGLLEQLATEQSQEQLLEVLEEALGARVIQELLNTAGHYQFTHSLIQEALLRELSLTRRVRLHARIAEALEKLYGSQAEVHAAELAHHFAEAESVLGTEKLVKYSLLAGEKALAAYAWEEAEEHFRRGLTARGVPLAGTEPAPDAEAAALLFGPGRAAVNTGFRSQLQESVDVLSRAFDYYEKAGDVARAVAVAKYPHPLTGSGRTGLAQIIQRALKLIDPESPGVGYLLSSYGAELGRIENDYSGAQEAFNRALVIARREKDIALEAQVLAGLANVDLFHLQLQEALEKTRQVLGLVHGRGQPHLAWSAHADATRVLLHIGGESEGLQHHGAATLELAEKLRDRFRFTITFRVNGTLCRQLGDWARARDFSERGLAGSSQAGNNLCERALLEYEVGNFGLGDFYLESMLKTIPAVDASIGSQYSFPVPTIAWVARVTEKLDRLDVAERCAQSVLASPFANPLFKLMVRVGLGLLAVLQDDVAAATEQYQALESQRSIMVFVICSDHLLGLLSETMGNVDQTQKHFEDALAFCRRAGYRPELAWTCCDYSDALLHPSTGPGRVSPDDRAKGMALLEEALAISRELGMRPLMDRVTDRLERMKSVAPAAPVYPDGLTQREVEVLRLIALGKSNREIAEELVISLNTVLRHVSHIFAKTGATNRVEVATYASRRELSP